MEKRTVPNDILIPEVAALVAEGRDVELMTKGNSMLPFIFGDRDSVLLRKAEEVKVNDVVLARIAGDRFVLHRVIARDGKKLTLMGDGNIRGTERCRVEDVLATAVNVIKPSGREVPIRPRRLWQALLPFRRIILGVFRRLPFIRNKIHYY